MDAAEPSTGGAGLWARAAAMLLGPSRAWRAIAAEPARVEALYARYVAPLALIAPVCGAVGLIVFGPSIAGIHLRASVEGTILNAAAAYVLTLVATWVLGLFVAVVAPLFGGVGDHVQAQKLVVYAGTAAWTAGVFALYPTVGFALGALGGLYSLYALYLGLPVLMALPEERLLPCYAAILAAALALAVAVRLATGFVA